MIHAFSAKIMNFPHIAKKIAKYNSLVFSHGAKLLAQFISSALSLLAQLSQCASRRKIISAIFTMRIVSQNKQSLSVHCVYCVGVNIWHTIIWSSRYILITLTPNMDHMAIELVATWRVAACALPQILL